MFHRWAALVLVLALWAMSPKNAAGQGNTATPRGHGAGALGNPYPNPFNPEAHIPFTVGDAELYGWESATCSDPPDQERVGAGRRHPALGGRITQSVSSSVVASADGRTSHISLAVGLRELSCVLEWQRSRDWQGSTFRYVHRCCWSSTGGQRHHEDLQPEVSRK